MYFGYVMTALVVTCRKCGVREAGALGRGGVDSLSLGQHYKNLA